ncbi:MAG: endonuclease/exonuclease/phosphatase family protein [Wenzhouxiangella sp.]|jgi:endonuclease/exonuclease/phosphatase family metal-dependent hydrolase|nr:endonuclease/exonuclease/phosphatase family protein [Wenzhouxiangella sp.]
MAANSRQLRLLSYNIQAGTTTGKYRDYVTHSWRQLLPNHQRVANLDSIAELLKAYDVVALQEVDCGSLRSGFLNQAKYLASHADFPFWHYRGNRKVGVIAHAGIGLLSRIEACEVEEHSLPGAIPGRGALAARFGKDHHALWLVVVHLALGRRARVQQLDYLSDLLRDYPNVVVMGDFNAGPASGEIRSFCERTGLLMPTEKVLTFPSWKPQRAIDHILVSPQMKVTEIKALPVKFSDHRPLSMNLRLNGSVQLNQKA